MPHLPAGQNTAGGAFDPLTAWLSWQAEQIVSINKGELLGGVVGRGEGPGVLHWLLWRGCLSEVALQKGYKQQGMCP